MNDSSDGSGDPLTLLSDFHRSTRMPLEAVVRLHFEGTVAYQNGFAANVSALGMFVKHPEPPQIGTRLVFEFVLGNERKPVQGAGVVAWLRERYEGPGRPAGVGIRFTELDALSRQHVAESLFEYLESQLGVDVADHPDVPDLLAAVPHQSPVALEVADVLTETASAPTEHLPPVAAEPIGESELGPAFAPSRELPPPRFQLFDESEGSSFDATPPEAERPAVFAIDIPPDEATDPAFRASSLSVVRARPRRDHGPWTAIGIAALIATAGFALWWFLLGPGSVSSPSQLPDDSSTSSSATAAPSSAAPLTEPQPATASTALPLDADPPIAKPASTETQPPVAASPEPVAEPAAGAAQPAAPVTTGPASHVAEIAWDAAPGGTVVTLIGDGSFAAGSFRWYEMSGDRPRILVRVLRMASGYPTPTIAVGTPELATIRIGYHEKPAGNELHVVLDLASGDVRVEGVEPENGRLVVRLASS